jgi:hypothetical protein
VCIFLDEISAVPDWQRGVKYLVDTGLTSETTIIVTGSHSMDIKGSAERMPGRRGQSSEVLDKLMLPMKFSEYVETLDLTVSKAIRDNGLLQETGRLGAIRQLTAGKIPRSIDKMSSFLNVLNDYHNQYLVTGGAPPVIDEYLKNGRVGEARYRDYVMAVLGDLSRYNKRETYVRQLINRLAEVLGTPISWSSLKKGTDIAHHETVAEYVDALGDNYTVVYLYRLDLNKRAPCYGAEKKIFFRDPFIFHALRTWARGQDPFSKTLEYLSTPENIGRLSENILCDHIVRLAFSLCAHKHTFEPATSVYYWRSKKDREIDFVVRTNDDLVGIECKCQEEIQPEDTFTMAEFNSLVQAKYGLIVSKDTLEVERNTVVIPLSLFLLLV